jgi:hypothetical protein
MKEVEQTKGAKIMKKVNTTNIQSQYGTETLIEKISWFFTHFLFVSNKRVFKIDLED